MIHHAVSSSAIKSVGYDEASMRMEIVFKSSSKPYSFCGVPKHVFERLLHAGSKGRYYQNNIKDHYQC
nr:KTSC domain-containing protein [uncultured Pseudodesulfovibrio sp.]